eukprot:4126708-Pyramimonas_sp.AAC.1
MSASRPRLVLPRPSEARKCVLMRPTFGRPGASRQTPARRPLSTRLSKCIGSTPGRARRGRGWPLR